MEIDPITGLPKELGAFQEISKESQLISVSTVKKKFGKTYTVVGGLEGKGVDVKSVTKSLKNLFACGGTYKDGHVELQGDYRSRIKQALVKMGYEPENIQVT